MKLKESLKGIPKSIWLISASSIINRIGMMVLPFLALYANAELGASKAEAGLLLTIYGMGAMVSSPFVGKLSDRFGELKLVKLSLYSSGVFLFLLSFVQNFYFLLALCFVWAIIGEAFRPAAMSFVAHQSPPAQRKIAYAVFRLALNLGMSIGPVLGGILSQIDYHLLFYVDGATSIGSALFISIINWDKVLKKYDDGEPPETEKQKINPFKDSQLILFLLAVAPVSLIFIQHFGSLPLYLVRDLGFANSTFGLLISVNTILIIIIELPLNNLMSSWNDKRAMMLGAFLSGAGFGLLVFVTDIYGIILSVVIWTFGEMIMFPASNSFAAEIAPAGRRGEYMGYYMMTFSFSFMAGPWLGTSILEQYGGTALWSGCFFLGIISIFLFPLIKSRNTE